MCEPMTIAMVGMSALSALGTLQQGRMEARAQERESDRLSREAGRARQASAYDQAVMRRNQAKELARQRTAQAAGGGRVDTGSNLDLNAQLVGEHERDISMRRYQGEAEAANYLQKGANARFAAGQTRKNSRFSAMTSFAKGAMGAMGGMS